MNINVLLQKLMARRGAVRVAVGGIRAQNLWEEMPMGFMDELLGVFLMEVYRLV